MRTRPGSRTDCLARRLGISMLALLAAAASPSTSAGSLSPNMEVPNAEASQLVVFFPPTVLRSQVGGQPAVLKILAAIHPELGAASVDSAGFHRFPLQAADEGNVSKLRDTIRKLGGTMGKVLPSPQVQKLDKVRVQAERYGIPEVLGLIVKYRGTKKRASSASGQPLSAEELATITRIVGKRVAGNRPMAGGAFAVYFDTATDLHNGDLLAARLSMSPEIESVELNTLVHIQLVPNDTFFSNQWSLTSPVAGIRAPQAWDITTGSTSVVVGVVDSGYLNHPDFSGRLVPGLDTISNPAISNDGDGRDLDATDSGTYASPGTCSSPSLESSSWHGTHVMGIIGATGNNGSGIAGVDWRARLLPVRALGRCGSGQTADIIDGMSWAAGVSVPGLPANPNPARVINMSISGSGTCGPYASAVFDVMLKGAIVVAAAGNSNQNALEGTPASCALVLTVSAVGPSGDKAPYSNYSTALEVSAPGGDMATLASDGIASTGATGTQADPLQAAYVYQQGTSQAAPHVSGTLSLMLSVAPSLTVAQMRDIIQQTVYPYPAGSRCATRRDCGPGILNAASAVSAARARSGQSTNYSSLWWRPAENGWGLNLQQQGNILFGTWFSYNSAGAPMWYVMPSIQRENDDVFFGDIYATTGTPLGQISGQQASRSVTKVGSANLYFYDFDKAVFLFEIQGVVGFKQIFTQEFAALPACTFTTASRANLANYQDLWWNPSESGWGINITHQGDILFATWFTYGPDGAPLWLVVPEGRKTGPGTYSGTLYQTTGRRPQDLTDSPAVTGITAVGNMNFAFSDGERGQISYTAFGQSGTKAVVRQVWSSPLSACR